MFIYQRERERGEGGGVKGRERKGKEGKGNGGRGKRWGEREMEGEVRGVKGGRGEQGK